jgi:limonene 1,2-monooxygenase
MPMPQRMKFGIFMAPFHEVGRNPTYSLERDMQLIQWLDQLGFDEAWVGEHHSAGWEIIASPEMYLAAAAERTRHIRLGTGVVSLPYHHPLMVANRIVLLDHLSRGRAMLGVGPGALVTDALMLGLDPTIQRQRMDESMSVIMRLLTDPEPLTYQSEWFTLREATLHLRPYSQPHMPVAVASAESPAGMLTAGKHGAGVLSLGVTSGLRGRVNLQAQWQIAEQEAAKHGKTMQREDWRLVIPVHLAESRQAALDDCRKGAARWQREYFVRTLGRNFPMDFPDDEVVDRMNDAGAWIVGTPDDLVAAIERFDEVTGGFGGLMVTTVEWTSREKVLKSYELIADYVMPRFQGSLTGLQGSNQRSRAMSTALAAARDASLERAYQSYERAPAPTADRA